MGGLESTHDLVAEGQRALGESDWNTARRAFERAVAQESTPEAYEGLSWALWWLNDTDVLATREEAYRRYKNGNDPASAARMAMWLASDTLDMAGDFAVATGWFQRARRLLEDQELVAEHGWLAMFDGSLALDLQEDTSAAKAFARGAIDVGRKLGIVDLEMMGLALHGISEVTEGSVESGMRSLDEAVAAALGGEYQQKQGIGWTCCYLIYACERVRDFDRAAQWCKRLEAFTDQHSIRFVNGVCRAHYAGVLVWRGRWDEAEKELMQANRVLESTRPGYLAEGLVRLGQLRLRQGRLDEAEEIFRGVEFHLLARLGLAEIALDRGDPDGARQMLEAALDELPAESRTQRAAVAELLVRAHAMTGRHEDARRHLEELEGLTESIPTAPLRGAVSFSRGVAAIAAGHYERARSAFGDAVRLFDDCGAPFEAARARLELAAVHRALQDEEAARRNAENAAAALDALGTGSLADRARAMRRPAGSATNLTPRELEVVRLIAQGKSDKQIAGMLTLSEHTVHRHVSNVLSKLECSSRAAAVAKAASEQLI